MVRAWDRAGVFAIAPFGDAEAESAIAGLTPELRYASFHLAEGARVRSGAEATKAVLSRLRGGRGLVVLRAHRLYPLVARFRGGLGRLVPDQPPTRVP